MERMKITFGDYWNDGHGKHETLDMLCNQTPEELCALEVKAEQLTGYRFQTNARRGDDVRPTTNIVNDYEDSEIPDDVIADLISQGFDNDQVIEGETYPLHDLEEGVEDFAEFFMRWLKLADETLEWEWTNDETPHAIFNCRGYGLFY